MGVIVCESCLSVFVDMSREPGRAQRVYIEHLPYCKPVHGKKYQKSNSRKVVRHNETKKSDSDD